MLFRVLCHRSISPLLSTKLRGICEIEVFDSYDEESIAAAAGDCDVLVSWLATPRIIESAKNLRFIQCWGVGVNQVDVAWASKIGIVVANMAGFNSAAVADYTLSAILLLTTRLHAYDQTIKSSISPLPTRAVKRFIGSSNNFCFPIDKHFLNRELRGRVLGIVGFGAIGQQIASRAEAFGMRIMAIKRTPQIGVKFNAEFIGTLKDLKMVLGESDIVSVNLPLTHETSAIFGADEFAAMKPSAYLINTSRAEVIDHKALLYALRNQVIAGAVLDVIDETHKRAFAKLRNVILTPHISGDTEEATARGIEVAAENIKQLLMGQSPTNIVAADKNY